MSHRLVAYALALLFLLAFLPGCDNPADLTFDNRSEKVVVCSLDGGEVARLEPHKHLNMSVEEGDHTAAIALEDGTVLFSQLFHIKAGQYLTYYVLSDLTVLAEGGKDGVD